MSFREPIDQMLDIAAQKLGISNRRELLEATGIQAPTVSKLRHKRISASGELILRLHDITGVSVNEIRAIMGHKILCIARKNAEQTGDQQSAQN